MADQDDRAFIVVERGSALRGCNVEVVGRLIQHQNIGAMEGGERKQQPRLLAT